MKTTAVLLLGAFASTATAADIKPLILGGKEVPAGTKTYVAGLRDTADGESFCGGSLITPKHILTAAHCTGVAWVSVGTHFLSGKTDGEQIRVAKEFVHPLYNDSTLTHDYLILELHTKSKFTPVPIAESDPLTYAGKKATTMGWGTTSSGGESSQTMLRVDVQVRSEAECLAANLSSPVDSTMFCAGGKLNRDSCQGDSGGPIILEREGKRGDLLLGAVSWGDDCGLKGKPGVYTRASQVVSWIREHAPGVQFGV